ncbi:MAG: glycosyltransferase, partial [Clostridia bacterium]|nr:glycosyltransferase [Clostridia bacterium]
SHVAAPRESWKHRLIKAWGACFFRRYPTQFCACSLAAGESKFPDDIVRTRLRVINNGIDLSRFAFNHEKRAEIRRILNISRHTLLLGHVGRFSEQKNHRFDLEILEELKKKSVTDIRLLWIGEGELEDELRRLAAEKGLQDVVIFQGVVMNVEDFLQAMDVFLLPSLFEGLGIVGVEAQAVGLPVLVSDRIPQDLKLTESVRFLPLGNAELWSDEILRHRGERHSENPVLIREKGYDISQTAAEVRALYVS